MCNISFTCLVDASVLSYIDFPSPTCQTLDQFQIQLLPACLSLSYIQSHFNYLPAIFTFTCSLKLDDLNISLSSPSFSFSFTFTFTFTCTFNQFELLLACLTIKDIAMCEYASQAIKAQSRKVKLKAQWRKVKLACRLSA